MSRGTRLPRDTNLGNIKKKLSVPSYKIVKRLTGSEENKKNGCSDKAV